MLLSVLLLAACKVEKPENTTVSADVQTNTPVASTDSTEKSKDKDNASKGAAKNLNITDQQVQIRLPMLKTQEGVGKYCYLQEMPNLDVGMTGLQFEAGEGVQFIRLQGVRSGTTNATTGKWSSCADLGEGIGTVALYEVVGVDLAESAGKLFNGFNWFSLPDQTAFGFPGSDIWLFEVQVQDGTRGDIEITTSVATAPKGGVEQWASVFEINMESTVAGAYESKCTLPQDLNVLSVFGHSEPTTGTWNVSCGDEELFAVQSEKFAGDVPPLKSFEIPKSIASGTTCTLKCDWGDESGQICLASLVATSMEKPMTCVDGLVNR
jgi:hypothetical protein